MATRPLLNRVWASTNAATRRDPGDAKYIVGWTSEIPTFQVLNFLQFKTDTTFLAIAERGIAEWNVDITYTKGALTFDANNATVYVSLVASPDKAKRPSANAAQWAVSSVQTTRADYDAAKATWTSHIAARNNPHGLTAGQLNAYTKAESDALIAQYQAQVATHANNKNNPHGTTATHIGAVPVTGGTYSGDVTFSNKRILLDTAGDFRLGVLSGGFWLQSGPNANDFGVIGITNGGVASVGTKTNQSPIVTEASFASQKALTENLYASPAPVFHMPLMNTANIYRGVGSCSSEANVGYSLSTGWSSWRGLSPVNLLLDGGVSLKTPLDGSTTCTLAIDIWYNGSDVSPIGPAGSRVVIGFGNAPGRTLIVVSNDGSGNRSVQGYGGSPVGLNKYNITDKLPHRFVWVRTATTQQLFVDGVPAGPVQTGMANVAISGNYQLIRSESSPNSGGEVQCLMSNFRAWREALTPEQISAL